MKTKEIFRKKYSKIRDAISIENRNEWSIQIIDFIKTTAEYQEASYIAIFYPIKSEVNLLRLLEDSNKHFCFPKIIDHEIVFIENTYVFEKGPFGIQEPVGDIVFMDQIDLIIVPGLVFSKDGYRIGYGKGYYDRMLKHYDKSTIGVLFGVQLVDKIPIDFFDIPVHKLISNLEVLCIAH